jgi:hypothetical protein
MMEDSPHVRVDSAKIEDVVQGFVYRGHGRDGVVVAIVGDVQQKERLRQSTQKIEPDKRPGTWVERIQRDPTASKDSQTCRDLNPHRMVCLVRKVLVGEKPLKAAA